MKIIGKKGLSGVSEKLFDVLIAVCGVTIAGLPWELKWYLRIKDNMKYYGKYLILLYVSGIITIIMLIFARALLHNINNREPYIPENAAEIRKIGICSAVMSCVYFVAIFFVPSFLVVSIAIAFAIFSVMSFIFSELLRKAVEYKKENELTI